MSTEEKSLDLKRLRRAKNYMELLSQGTDPISGEHFGADSVLDQDKIKQCFSFVKKKLDLMIRQEERANDKFTITPEKIAQIPISQEPISITPFCVIITEYGTNPDSKPLAGSKITHWLEQCGYLTSVPKPTGGIRRINTEKGKEIGIITTGNVEASNYKATPFYTPEAQRFILDHLIEILDS